MTPRDWTLLAIDASPHGVLEPVQLQKVLFLFSENLKGEVKGAQFHRFKAYDYGPFSSSVYADAEALEAEGLVQIKRSRYRLYCPTPDGKARAAGLRDTLPAKVTAYVDDAVSWCVSLSFDDLVTAIYKKYPQMKANSVFQG